MISTVRTVELTGIISARIAVAYPEPVPISSTRSRPVSCNASIIAATTNGCEIVCPQPMSSGRSASASSWYSSGTKKARGTRAKAASTRGSRTPWSMSRRTSRLSLAVLPSLCVHTAIVNLGFVRIVGQADAVALGIAQVDGPARAVDDLHSQVGEPSFPGMALVRGDAQREQVQSSVRIAKRRLRLVHVARFQRDEFLTLPHREPHGALASSGVLAGPAPHHLEPQDVGVEAHRAIQVLDLDGDMVMAAHGRQAIRVYEG